MFLLSNQWHQLRRRNYCFLNYFKVETIILFDKNIDIL